MLFKLGWKLLGFLKLLTIGYCVMRLVQNCVTLGTSQLMGEVTNAIRSAGAPKNTAPAANAPATAPANPAVGPSAFANAPARPETSQKSPLLLVVLCCALALAMLAVLFPMRALATQLD